MNERVLIVCMIYHEILAVVGYVSSYNHVFKQSKFRGSNQSPDRELSIILYDMYVCPTETKRPDRVPYSQSIH